MADDFLKGVEISGSEPAAPGPDAATPTPATPAQRKHKGPHGKRLGGIEPFDSGAARYRLQVGRKQRDTESWRKRDKDSWARGPHAKPQLPQGANPREWVDAVAAARVHTEEAVQTLVKLMRSSTDEHLRAHCAEAILNRGWGKPTLAVAVTEAPKLLYGIDAPLRPVESPEAWLERRRKELSALTIDAKPLPTIGEERNSDA